MTTRRLLALACAILLAACTTTQSDAGSKLWVGTLQLCETTVADVSQAEDIAGQPTLRISLNEGAREELSTMTARMIGRTLPIKLGDKVLMEPIVQERITGGVVDISPLPDQGLERIEQAAGEAC